jgi:hypothetical protein
MRSRVLEAYKTTLRLTPEQCDVLVGLLLGDACLESRNQGRTYRVKVEQSARHEPYVQHLYGLFQPWVLSPPHQRQGSASNGSTTISWAFNTVSHAAFRFYAHQFYGEQGKQVPALIHKWLTPRGLAYWFMDDGSMKSNQSKGVIFNTQGFTKPDVERLALVLQARFLLQAKLRHQSDGYQIYVSGSSYERFVELIDPWLLDEMRYKVPQARRTRLPKW